jgi:hypothetical protein
MLPDFTNADAIMTILQKDILQVATGHSSDEQLPMVLKVPHLTSDPCYAHTYR